jgi:hypothetical protein
MKQAWLSAGLFLLLGGNLEAQIPERFENLQVLPQTTTRPELVAVMRSFATGLGVRCVHCHVGEDNPNLTGIDFKSDAKPAKRTAREMMRMVADINQRLAALPERSAPVNASCVTCHRGFVRPIALEDTLHRAIAARGAQAALAEYDTLRSRFHGRATFDFGFTSLHTLAEGLYNERRYDDAVAMLRKNLVVFPDRWESWFELGRNYEMLDRRADAIEAYRALIMRVPNHAAAAARIRALTGGVTD